MSEQESTIELLVGRIGRAHGIRGDVSIDVRTDEPERRFVTGTVFKTPRGAVTLTGSRWHGQRLLATFAEATDRTTAEALRGTELRVTVPAAERPEDPEEFYDHQLVGLLVVDVQGVELGRIADVLHLPAQDVFEVRLLDGREILLPFVSEMVPEVDLAVGHVVADPPAGLLDPDEATVAAPDETGV